MVAWVPRMPTWLPVLLVLLLAALPPCAGDCDPDALDDDRLNQMADSTTRRSFPNGTVHTYRCKNGYRPANERRNATCRGTLWELDVAQPLNCRGLSCGAPGGQNGIEHGTFRSHVFNFPNKVQFNCDRGHRLHTHNDQPVGSDYAIYCQSDGKWTAPPPKCLIVTCPALASVDNGQVDRSEGIKYRSTAYYACSGGYRLVGPSTRGCQENGTWSGVEPVCETIKCPKPDNPPHGHVLVTGTEIGDIIVYRCLTDNSKVSSTCLAQGVWSRDPPVCPPEVVTARTTTTTTTSTTTTTVAPTLALDTSTWPIWTVDKPSTNAPLLLSSKYRPMCLKLVLLGVAVSPITSANTSDKVANQLERGREKSAFSHKNA